eukprot:SM000156S02146  [mRNA]  locus=s156:156708:157050:- [translate_table: standard]
MAMDPPTSRKQVTWSDGGSGDAAALPRSAFVAPPLLAVATPQVRALLLLHNTSAPSVSVVPDVSIDCISTLAES